MSPLTTHTEDAATEFLTRRIRLSGLPCTARLGLGALTRTGAGKEEKGHTSGKQVGDVGDLPASWP